MIVRKYLTLTVALLVACGFSNAEERVGSAVYAWDDLEVVSSETKERRYILHGETSLFETLKVHASTVAPGTAYHGAHTHDEFEELFIIKEGTLEVMLNGESHVLPAGSVVLVLPGDKHGLRNAGGEPATYYVLNWKTKGPRRTADPSTQSIVVNWDELEVKEIAKGLRRNIMRVPTAMLAEFEMHTTTLNTGVTSHAQHTHAADEIILVRFGRVEQLIDGEPHQGEAGDVIFLGTDIPHGIRNAGEEPCEYYAFKWSLK